MKTHKITDIRNTGRPETDVFAFCGTCRSPIVRPFDQWQHLGVDVPPDRFRSFVFLLFDADGEFLGKFQRSAADFGRGDRLFQRIELHKLAKEALHSRSSVARVIGMVVDDQTRALRTRWDRSGVADVRIG